MKLKIDSQSNTLKIIRCIRLIYAFHILAFLSGVSAVFEYPDLNQTLGLVFNGDAKTTNCVNETLRNINVTTHEEKDSMHITTITDRTSTNFTKFCKTRMRLTPDKPDAVGSVWYEKRVPVVSFYATNRTRKIYFE